MPKGFFPGYEKGHDAEESSCTLLVRVRFLEVLRTHEITLAFRRSPEHDVDVCAAYLFICTSHKKCCQKEKKDVRYLLSHILIYTHMHMYTPAV